MAVRLGTNQWGREKLYYTDLNDTFNRALGFLGELRMICISVSGAETIANMRIYGWAIADGTTPVTQGITNPVITTTPDIRNKFIRASDDNTSGTTGGSDTHTLTVNEMPSHTHGIGRNSASGPSGIYADYTADSDNENYYQTAANGGGQAHNNLPSYYESVIFIKVK